MDSSPEEKNKFNTFIPLFTHLYPSHLAIYSGEPVDQLLHYSMRMERRAVWSCLVLARVDFMIDANDESLWYSMPD